MRTRFLPALALACAAMLLTHDADARSRARVALAPTVADANASGRARLSIKSPSDGQFEVKVRRPLVRVANAGVTASVDAAGRVNSRFPLDVAGAFTVDVLPSDVATPLCHRAQSLSWSKTPLILRSTEPSPTFRMTV